MKFGILGTGMIVKMLLRTIHTLDFEKIYVLGTEATRKETEEIAKNYGFDKCFYDYDELLTSDVDTIYVALPNHLHYSFTKKALEANKHVICEKPFTSNYKELKDLIRIANERKLILVEAMNIHYHPTYIALKDELKLVGSIKIISMNYSQYSSRYNAFKEGIIMPAFDYKKSGGALMDINVYNIHFIVGLFGKPNSIHYQANIEHQIDTSGILTMDYGDFKVSCIGAKDCKAPIISTIQGDLGVIQINKPANQFTTFDIINNQGEIITKEYDIQFDRLHYEFQEFIEIIHTKDYDKCNKMLEISSICSELMEEARHQQGIYFLADKEDLC